ncbi:uncharacterized protein [Narcine bancroftii]|uniref:uncharacterized protein n=1 Tax=Narcine bancroftii TaxID=1343680 RepID=UPI0038315557
MSFGGPSESQPPPQEGTPPRRLEPGASLALAIHPTVAFTNLRPPGGQTPDPSSDTSEASVPADTPPDTGWGSGIRSPPAGWSPSREDGGAPRQGEAGSRGRPAAGLRPQQELGARCPSDFFTPADGQRSGRDLLLAVPSGQGSGQNPPSDAPSGKASDPGALPIDPTPSSQDSLAGVPEVERWANSSADRGSKEGSRSTPGSGEERVEAMLDREMGHPPPRDLWKTPFWIIEDFQAPRQAPPSRPAPAAEEEEAAGGGDNDGPSTLGVAPYCDLDPEDLEAYRLFNSRTPPGVRDSELMDVPDEDVEFWGKFYFVGVEKARELIEERRKGPRVQ